jgi:hypothetical protein
MSSNGWRQLDLERQRRAELRRRQATDQCAALIAACEAATANLRNPVVLQAAAEGLKRVRQELRQGTTKVAQNPESALIDIRAAQRQLHNTIAKAEAAAHKWSHEQAQAKARLAELAQRAEAESASTRVAGEVEQQRVQQAVGRAAALHEQGHHREALKACEEAESALQARDKAAFDETVRREVVRGLISTLAGMGFVIEGPRLQGADSKGGVVALSGQLPSGRRARFEVQVDGRMNFDFEGYEERACGKDLAHIERTLQERCGVQLGPTQVVWKNPDRLTKGARPLPTSQQNTH